jgi:hypothetical protein
MGRGAWPPRRPRRDARLALRPRARICACGRSRQRRGLHPYEARSPRCRRSRVRAQRVGRGGALL